MTLRAALRSIPVAAVTAACAATACGGQNANARPANGEAEPAAVPTSTTELNQAPMTPYPPGTANTAPPSGTTSFEEGPPGGGAPSATGSLLQGAPRSFESSRTGAVRPVRPAEPLDDAQILELALDLQNGEMHQAQYVASHAENPKVQGYARRVVGMRTDVAQSISGTARARRVTPAKSSQSTDLRADATSTLEVLENLTGPELDRSFLNQQIHDNEWALELLDQVLLPDVHDGALRGELMRIRSVTSDDLRSAKDLLSTLTVSSP